MLSSGRHICIHQTLIAYRFEAFSDLVQTAFATVSAMAAAGIVFCFILRFFLERDNDRSDRRLTKREASDTENGQDGVSYKSKYVLQETVM